MILFFSLAALLVLLALALLLPGLLRKQQLITLGRDTKNITIARERLAEIERDLEQRLISSETYTKVRDEIEAGLADDLTYEPGSTASDGGQWVAVVIACLLPVLAGGIYLTIGTPSAMNPDATAIARDDTSMPSEEDIPAMIESLAARMEESPEDAEGWALLGRSYMSTGQYQLAVTAFDRLLALTGDHPLILLMLADSLTMSEQGRVSDRSRDLISRSLALDPDNPQGLWMGGISAIQSGDAQTAIRHWEKLEPMLAANPEQQSEIRSLINNAAAMVNAETSLPEIDDGETVDTVSEVGSESITVEVVLDPMYSDDVDANDTVFIFARAANGPPMPLAARRVTVSELPVTIVLDDTDAMTPAMTLSQFSPVVVGARISRSGNAIAQPGDIEGGSGEVVPGETGTVSIDLNRVVE